MHCVRCGTEIAPSLVACPACGTLVHAEELKAIAAQAEAATAAGDLGAAVAAWRAALTRLPEGSAQYVSIVQRINALTARIDQQPRSPGAITDPSQPWWKRGWAAIAAGAVFLLSKAKLLLLGLTKASTFFSMLLFLGVYWAAWGWKFALGFVLGIYIHEMGHVAALARYGIAASAPMFIPGLGAVVRLRQALTDPHQDAVVGLAGPLWGLAAGLVAWGIGMATGAHIWFGIAQATGFINLFNLIPFWQLDGGRGFHALTRAQRVAAAACIAVCWALSGQGILVLILILAIWQVFNKGAPTVPDRPALLSYCGLVIALTWLTSIPVNTTR